MTEPRQYSRETVLMARAGIVVAGSALIGLGAYAEAHSASVLRFVRYALEAIGAIVLGFGAFARGNLCVNVFYRVLYLLQRRPWPPNR